MSSKKITYSSDFKLKVLDYYFKHGGDDKFGLKKKTAGHFNIDKKTINRMLNNPDMVKRARKLLAARKATSAKTPSNTRQPVKPAVRKAGGNANKSSTNSRTASSNQTSASSSSNKPSTSSTSSTKTVGSNSRQQGTTSSSNKNTPTKTKPGGLDDKNTPGVEIFELPEDPDYSLLKRSINAASNGVASLAKLLVTGTEEVRNVVLNECDVILECKVCRNLFRSVVNFLAHKRIYCQEEFADVRTLFHKGDVQGVTSQSNTIVVEPEPPPENENYNPVRTTIPTTYTSPIKPLAQEGRSRRSGIDTIAMKLARKRKAHHHTASSSTHTGTSSYFQSLSEVSRSRDKLSRDCSVVLEDIGGVANAVFQTYVPPGSPSSRSTSMSCIVDEASHSKSGISVAINQNGEIVKTAPGDITSMEVEEPTSSSESRDLTCLLCNTRFATQKTLSVHQRSHHGYERCIYYCPICQTSFLSMWAVVKHLQRTHKKKKNQIERLRKVVKKNVRKKMVYKDVDKNKNKNDPEPPKKVEEEEEDDEEEEEEEEDSSDSPTKASETVSPKKSEVDSPVPTSPVKLSPHKDDESNPRRSPDHRCVKCDRKFSTPCALVSHDRFCSLMQMMPPENSLNPRLRSETPAKKITIQIRKDYKKPITRFDLSESNLGENKNTQVMFKVPQTVQEKVNQSKIEVMMSEFCNLPSFSCIPCGRRYQSITALKRHAAHHIDWTRYECKICKYRSYHRYKSMKHCITEHEIKESAAASMVVDEEHVGPLKYFLDNEDSTPASSDTEQDYQEEPLPPIISLPSDRGSDAPTNIDDTESKPSEMELEDTCHLETDKPSSDNVIDQNVQPDHHIKVEHIETPENEISKECNSTSDKAKDLSHQEMDGNDLCHTATEILEEPVASLDASSDQKSPVEGQNPGGHISQSLHDDMRSHDDTTDRSSCEEVNNETPCKEEIKKSSCEKENIEKLCKEEILDSLLEEDVPVPKDHIIEEENVFFKSLEIPKEEDTTKIKSISSDKVLEVDVCSISSKEDNSSTNTGENAAQPENQHTKKMQDVGEDQHTEKIQDTLENVGTEKIQDVVKENSSHQEDTDDDTAVVAKTDDMMSGSSHIETIERDSLTECSEQTTLSQSASVDTGEEEILISESESEILCDEIEEIESISNLGRDKWKVDDETLSLLTDTKDIDLYAYESSSLVDVYRYKDMKCDTNFGVFYQTDKDVKPNIPKDDLSLELKDFVGFPSEKDEKFERPHRRMRRRIEQTDFIYDDKKAGSQKPQSESDGCCSISSPSPPPKEITDSKQERGRCNLRRRSSLVKSEVVAKKIKSEEPEKEEEEEYKRESCNGSSFQSTASKKNEDNSISQKKDVTVQLSEASGYEGSSSPVERRRVRLVRQRFNVSPCGGGGGDSLPKDDNKSRVNESGKGKNLEKGVSESNGTSSKSLIKKESPTVTRYSSRLKTGGSPVLKKEIKLKTGSSPVLKKENKQDVLNSRMLTNGQGQSDSVVPTAKVKL